MRVFNYAASIAGDLEICPKDRHKASSVQLEIQTSWMECSLSSEGNFTIPACERPLGLSDLVLSNFVPASLATRAQFGSSTLGIAAQPERGTPASASVFYDRVEQLAKGGTASVPVVLGHAGAHEIGHLLLGSNSHTPQGLMRARWSRQDLQNASIGNLLFTSEQTQAMSAEGAQASIGIVTPLGKICSGFPLDWLPVEGARSVTTGVRPKYTVSETHQRICYGSRIPRGDQ